MKTALIITTYNRPDALNIVLASALKQTLMPNEILIADDGSPKDETENIINQYAQCNILSTRIKHIWHPDKGFRLSEIRNKAIAATNCEHIIFVDDDMILHDHFIADHRAVIAPKQFIQGSQILLSQSLSKKLLREKITIESLTFWQKGIEKKLSNIYFPQLGYLLAKRGDQTFENIKGCNMAFWREDAILINGFNQDFIGWGYEDREFVARLYHHGITRHNLNFAGIAYHLWHRKDFRSSVSCNDRLLKNTINQSLLHCENGLNQWL